MYVFRVGAILVFICSIHPNSALPSLLYLTEWWMLAATLFFLKKNDTYNKNFQSTKK